MMELKSQRQKIEDQIAALEAQARMIRVKEKAEAIEVIEGLMAKHNLSTRDLTRKATW